MDNFLKVIFQLSLVEREINEVIRGAYLHSSRGNGTKSSTFLQDGREKLKQKQVTEEDVCPICQEEFLSKPEPLTYCKYDLSLYIFTFINMTVLMI